MNAFFKRSGSVFLLSVALCAVTPTVVAIEPATTLKALGRMPVREITVFKDGHAFVAQEGSLPTDSSGNVLVDRLPAPVIGTFWAYSAEKNAKLSGVVASQRRVSVERTALSLMELIEANIGAEATITEVNSNRYDATLVGIPTRTAEELEATGPPGAGERLPESGNIILLKTSDGVKVLAIDHIKDVTFKKLPKPAGSKEEFRNLLTLKLDWGKTQPATNANVGLLYLQKGIRWVPSYKITIDGKGNAVVKLQATLINELVDLENASVNLVVGVPSFTFKGTLDPISLQQTAAQLSQYFQANPSSSNPYDNNVLANNFSNSIMTQQAARSSEYRSPVDTTAESGADAEATKNEDLFVFNAGHITLKKGERMVLPLAEYTLPYKDVFTLELPFSPPAELNQNLNTPQQREIARLYSAPKVMHKIRLTNNGHYPLTTAPALLFRDGSVLSQGMMTYTAIGAQSDLTITTAVDISCKKSDTETGRVPNALVLDGNHFTRVDLDGKILLTSHRAQPSEIEVTRFVLGNFTSANHDGKTEKINAFEDLDEGIGRPEWWNSYGSPRWWTDINGVGRVTWKLKLDAGQSTELNYKWNYFWRYTALQNGLK